MITEPVTLESLPSDFFDGVADAHLDRPRGNHPQGYYAGRDWARRTCSTNVPAMVSLTSKELQLIQEHQAAAAKLREPSNHGEKS